MTDEELAYLTEMARALFFRENDKKPLLGAMLPWAEIPHSHEVWLARSRSVLLHQYGTSLEWSRDNATCSDSWDWSSFYNYIKKWGPRVKQTELFPQT